MDVTDLRPARARGASRRISGNTITLSGATLLAGSFASLTVTALDAAQSGGVRMGGDDLHVGTYVHDDDERRGEDAHAHGRQDVGGRRHRLRRRPAGRHRRRRRRLHDQRCQRLRAHAFGRGADCRRPARCGRSQSCRPASSAGRARRSSSTATRRRTASGTAAIRRPSTGRSSATSRSTRSSFIPIAQNEDATFLVALANPFRYAGNDVIDASALFANVVCNATCSDLPTRRDHRLRRRGRRHDHRLQAGDFLAGGSGNDTILGLRGNDQIYGDSGLNVDVLTRALTIPAYNAGFTSANVDLLLVAGQRHALRRGRGHDRQRRRRAPRPATTT